MADYKVLIPSAGTGSRLGEISKYLNKSLLAVANKPIISHIIEKFPEDVEFVIALGYKGSLIQDFLELAYPQRKFSFVDVNPFEGEGSGLGLSVLACKELLQCPFIFCSNDTIVSEAIPKPTENWIAYAKRDCDLSPYRTIKVEGKQASKLLEKGAKEEGIQPYIGLSGIKDYETFWQILEQGGEEAIRIGESLALRDFCEQGNVAAHEFTWFDTGNVEELAQTREALRKPNAPNILEKANEAIWFVDGSVIKFSSDKDFIANRVKRVEVLGDFVPQITGQRENMYKYQEVPGDVLSNTVNIKYFKDFLAYSQEFWTQAELNTEQEEEFKKTCMKFYKDKTLSRIELYYKNFKQEDKAEIINGYAYPKISELLEQVNWNWLAEGQAGRFHGDFHFENIVHNLQAAQFKFLDWRQEFGGVIEYGDIYYDFGKLNHGLIVSHGLIDRDLFTVGFNGSEPKDYDANSSEELVVDYDLNRKQILVDCEQYFEDCITKQGYDYGKVYMMTALIYLNIAALHHYPYCHLLYFLGKTMLKHCLETYPQSLAKAALAQS